MTPSLVLAAVDVHRLDSVSFWDALVIGAIRRATEGSRAVLERLQPGLQVPRVQPQ